MLVPGVLLALDWGLKRVGFATADSEGLVVTPRGHFKRAAIKSAQSWTLHRLDIVEINKLIEAYEVKIFLLGLPLHPSGHENDSSEGARRLAAELKKEFSMPVLLINEALTSWESRNSADNDAQAAALLLEDYFQAEKRKASPNAAEKRKASPTAAEKRKAKSGGFAVKALLAILFVTSLAYLGYNYYRFTSLPIDSSRPGTFVLDIPPASNFGTLRKNFSEQNAPIDRLYLKLWLQFVANNKKLRVGEFEIDRSWSQSRALHELLFGPQLMHKVVVKEGHNIYDIEAEYLRVRPTREANELSTLFRSDELLAKVEIPESVPRLHRTLEGFLFPETYAISKYDSAKTLVTSMIEEFKHRALPILKDHEIGSTMEGRYKLLVLASIVEKESGNKEEQPLIASVFWNRINKQMKLQSDPTTIYALFPTFNGNLTRLHLSTPSPYNTYTIAGLPVGPISNPGETAIRAVVKPADTKFLFFVAKGDGTHVFSEDFKTHNAYVRKFQLKQ